MPVLVPLIDLVSVPNTRPLWPAAFAEAVTRVESGDRAVAGELADRLDDIDEPDLAAGFRYLFTHPDVRLNCSRACGDEFWEFKNLPAILYYTMPPAGTAWDRSTAAGAVAYLARKIKQAREDLG